MSAGQSGVKLPPGGGDNSDVVEGVAARADIAQQLIAEGRKRGYSANDIVATLTALTAASIADSYRRFAPERIAEVIVAGGGAHNPAMMAFLTDELDSTPLLMSDQIDLSSDYKEGLVFALLAHETWHNRPDNLPSLTGAKSRVVLGQITPGSNYIELVRKTLC